MAEASFEERPSLNTKIYVVFTGKSRIHFFGFLFFSKGRSTDCVVSSKASVITKGRSLVLVCARWGAELRRRQGSGVTLGSGAEEPFSCGGDLANSVEK